MEQESGERRPGNGRAKRKPRPIPFDLSGLRIPPHSLEAEQAVLGGLLLDNSTWDTVADRLRRRRLLPARPPADLPGHPRPFAERRTERCRHAGRAARQHRPCGRNRRSCLPGRTRARHAHGREHPGLRRYRPRALAAAAADPCQRRNCRQRLRERRPVRQPNSSMRPSAGLPDRGEGPAPGLGLRARARGARRHDRSPRHAARIAGAAHRPQYRLYRTRQDDRRTAAWRSRHHCGPSLDGQDDARAQHRGERGDRAPTSRSRFSRWKCRASSWPSA